MKRPNFYAAGGLDRVGHLRKDADWLTARLADETARFVPVWRAQNLIRDSAEGPRPILLTSAQAAATLAAGSEVALLGLEGGLAHFAIDLSSIEAPFETLGLDPAEVKFRDLRAFGPLLGPGEGSLLAYA